QPPTPAPTAPSSSPPTSPCESCGVGRSCRLRTVPSRATTPDRILVPTRSTTIACPACTVGTVNPRMAAPEQKPYRVYRGGRTKGKVPLERRRREQRRGGRSRRRGPGKIVERRRRLWLGWTWRRWTLVAILGLVVLFAVWGVAGYLSVSSRGSDANARLPHRRAPRAP